MNIHRISAGTIASLIVGSVAYFAHRVSHELQWALSALEVGGLIVLAVLAWTALYRLAAREETDADDRKGWVEAHRKFSDH